MKVLVVCFANTCRSPVAETLLAQKLAHEPGVIVASKGLEGGPGLTPGPMTQALSAAGLSLISPSGERFDRADVEADLFLFLERSLLREGVVNFPVIWARSFTMREFARRAQLNPPDPTQETFAQWTTYLDSTRDRAELLGLNADDDVLDPGLGGDQAAFAEMIRDLDELTTKIAPFLSGWTTAT